MRRETLICLFLVAAILVVYWQVMDHEFIVYDDNVYVTDNPYVKEGLTGGSASWALTTTKGGNWHPLTWLSHMLDCQLYGLNPWGHHLTSVIFHIANTILLFLCLRWMTAAVWRSALVAALFALHPLHVESVAWVAERKDVLSTFFWMLTTLAYINYAKRPKNKRYLFVFVFFSLGLMAKPMLVTLPFVLLLLDYWPLNRLQFPAQCVSAEDRAGSPVASSQQLPLRKLIMEKVPLLVMSGVSCAITVWAQQQAGALSGLKAVPYRWRMTNGLVSYVSYIGKMIWPQGLAVFYPHPVNSLPIWESALAGFFLVIVSAVVVRLAIRYQYGFVGWLWYLGTLVPVIGLVQVGEQAIADRYTYVPLIGLFIVIAWWGADIGKGSRHRLVLVNILAMIFVLGLTVCSRQQVRYWKNSIDLFENTLEVTADNYVAHFTLGNALALRGNLVEAITHYEEALRIRPNYAEAHHNLGNALALRGNLVEAITHYKEALRINPNYAEAHRNLGVGLDQQGNHEEAMYHYAEALRINPEDSQSHNNLGVALAEQGRLDEAIAHFAEAVRINPNFAEAQRNLEQGLRLVGKSTATSSD